MIQGPLRWTYGNNREEIHYLLKPILRAIKLYDPCNNPLIKNIFEYAIKGLKLLKMSYNNSSSTLCHALDLYINLIEYSFNNDSKLIEKYYLNFSNENLNLSQNSKLNLENYL